MQSEVYHIDICTALDQASSMVTAVNDTHALRTLFKVSDCSGATFAQEYIAIGCSASERGDVLVT